MGSITRSFANLITANGPSAVADGSVTTGDISGNINFKNIIINGDMSVAQRGTSVSSITSSGYYTVDRFNTLLTTMGTWTQSQDSDVPSGQGFSKSLKMACTTADASPASGDIIALRLNIIEGQNLQYLKFGTSSAESLTLSFWVKSNKTGTYVVAFYNANGGYQLGKTITISSADTWEKKTITISGDTAHSFANNNSAQLYLTFYLGVGSNRTSGTLPSTWTAYAVGDEAPGQTVNLADNTANYINITGVQLEAGTTASDFEFLPKDIHMLKCQRYYENSWRTEDGYYPSSAAPDDNDGMYEGSWNDGNCSGPYFKVEKRTTPSMIYYPNNSSTAGQVNQNGTNKNASSGHNSTKCISHVSVSSPTANVWTHYRWVADAEL